MKVALAQQITKADAKYADLVALVECDSLTVAIAAEMFEAKLDGLVSFGRWLLATAWGAGAVKDKAYGMWARGTLGSPQ